MTTETNLNNQNPCVLEKVIFVTTLTLKIQAMYLYSCFLKLEASNSLCINIFYGCKDLGHWTFRTAEVKIYHEATQIICRA